MGTPHTGGGGGGGGGGAGGEGARGGSGIIIIRYYVVSSITHEYLALTHNTTDLIFNFREDETPYSWQEAYDEAIANGERMPNKSELRAYLTANGAQYPNIDAWCPVIAPEYSNGKDRIHIGSNVSGHYPGKSHTEAFGYASWQDNTSNTCAKYYCAVSPTDTTAYQVTHSPKMQLATF